MIIYSVCPKPSFSNNFTYFIKDQTKISQNKQKYADFEHVCYFLLKRNVGHFVWSITKSFDHSLDNQETQSTINEIILRSIRLLLSRNKILLSCFINNLPFWGGSSWYVKRRRNSTALKFHWMQLYYALMI